MFLKRRQLLELALSILFVRLKGPKFQLFSQSLLKIHILLVFSYFKIVVFFEKTKAQLPCFMIILINSLLYI